jgi:hypothetical protein
MKRRSIPFMNLPNLDENDSTVPRLEMQTAVKKPYHKPAFHFERVFETRALQCGKVATQGQCQLSVKTS